MNAISASVFLSILNQIPLPVSIFELVSREEMDFKYIFVNDYGVQYSGYDRHFWIGKNIKAYSPAIYDGVAAIPQAMIKVLDTQQPISMDTVPYIDNTLGPTLSSFTILYLKENQVAVIAKAAESNPSITHDLSIQKQMLEMGEHTTGSCSWVFNEVTGETTFTPAYLKVHHFNRKEITPQNAYKKTIARIHQDDREHIERLHQTVHDHYPVAARYRYLREDHSLIWLKDTISQKRADGILIGTTQDVTEIQERESQLRHTLKFLEKIMQTSPEIIHIFDLTKQKNIFANEALFQQTGYTVDELLQMGTEAIPYLVHPEDRERVLHHNLHVLPNLAKGQLTKIEIRLHNKKTNTYFYFESLQSVFEQDAHGNNLRIIGIGRNIHAQKQAEAEVLKKNKELEQYAYVASHDLQEPLRTITSFTDLLVRRYTGKLDETADTYLHYIKESSTHMHTLVKALLEYGRLGRKSKLTQVDINLIIQKVLSDLNTQISENGATFDLEQLPVLRGYEIELRLLFQNLLSNAIKFHAPGRPPRIRVSAEKETGFWKFSVQDNGIGIPEQYQNKIFFIFQRLNNIRDYEGTGIGLAHCRKIVELHGGQIWLKSHLHKGSTFYVRLPA